jgi:ferritin-like metal-binding protein YciE
MAIQNPRDLFLYDLRAMYDLEQKMVQVLPVLAQECMDNAAREAFVTHEAETRQHVLNLEQCFQALGSQPATLENNAAAGLKTDHDNFLQQQPPPQALTLFDVRAGYLSECLEIAAYRNLIDAANGLGLSDCVLLMQQNLQQEINAAQKLSAIARQYSQPRAQSQPAQNAAPAAPAPQQNPYAAAANQPLPGQQPSSAQNAQMPVPDQSNENANQPATYEDRKGNTVPQAMFDRVLQMQRGMPVVGSDGSNVGLIKEVRENDFLVDIPMHRDLYVPFSAIQNVDDDQVVLNIPGHQVVQMDWPRPSLF